MFFLLLHTQSPLHQLLPVVDTLLLWGSLAHCLFVMCILRVRNLASGLFLKFGGGGHTYTHETLHIIRTLTIEHTHYLIMVYRLLQTTIITIIAIESHLHVTCRSVSSLGSNELIKGSRLIPNGQRSTDQQVSSMLRGRGYMSDIMQCRKRVGRASDWQWEGLGTRLL